MLSEAWDMAAVWAALDAAWGDPAREEAVLAWLLRRSPSEWARLDEGERRSWYIRRPSCPPERQSCLALGWRSLSADGHVREAAVTGLSADPHPAALGFLLLRCDDWVEPVRDRALRAVTDRLDQGTLDWVCWLPLILARDARRRAGGLLARCAAQALRLSPAQLLGHPDRATRRWATGLLLGQPTDPAALAGWVRSAVDPTVACALAARLAERLDDDGLARLTADRRAGVRRAAWRCVLAGRLPGLNLGPGLLDPAPSIREIAQQVARRRAVDAGAVYATAPSGSPAERRRRLLGLGEWGASGAAPLAQQALGDPDTSVRVAAITVLARREQVPGPTLLALLPGVRGAELRAVIRGLQRRRVWVGDEVLRALRAGASEQRQAAWRLGRAQGRWERLLAGLHASADPDPTLARLARADLESWVIDLGPRLGGLSPAQRAPLEEALGRATVSAGARSYLEFVFKI